MTLVVRENDAAECRAAGLEPEEALAMSIARSDEVYEARAPNGELLGLWGLRVAGFLTSRADMWLLTGDGVFDHPIYFARESRRLMRDLLATYSTLTCEVHAKYSDSLDWLGWLGFKRVGVHHIGSQDFYIMQKERG